MNYKMMGRFIGHILLVEAVFMIVPLAISLYHKEKMATIGFAASLSIILLFVLILSLACKGSRKGFVIPAVPN